MDVHVSVAPIATRQNAEDGRKENRDDAGNERTKAEKMRRSMKILRETRPQVKETADQETESTQLFCDYNGLKFFCVCRRFVPSYFLSVIP